MSEVCFQHRYEPVKIYFDCVACEIESLRRRIEHLEQSLNIERDFALQWDGISTAYRIEKALNKKLD